MNVNYVHKLVIRNYTKPIAEACERRSDFALKIKGPWGGGGINTKQAKIVVVIWFTILCVVDILRIKIGI